eukprot:CAMPEP_0176098720 /NCGR_PEP_ID=MMETSP0120_2-20121206/49500_1 /TAXON_ID=160619 /ORGANISM="Kryptoperidinium foliaceum, Strain CCMP 1326" /LENGTH=35 /DNA_ID= /DNA_START= /DNA_END= /DNA_ORIENTATION=
MKSCLNDRPRVGQIELAVVNLQLQARRRTEHHRRG